MSNPAEANIVAAVRSVRRLTRDVAKLLTTAREFLENAGWKSRTTQAISVSTSLNIPENWVPQDAFWFAFNGRYPKHLLVVSVLIDSVETPDSFTLPVVMSGYVRFAQPVRANWSFRWARLCEKVGSIADGEFREMPLAAFDRAGDVEQAEIAVRPLVSITSSELLEGLVLKPLLSRIDGR
jgi:hypothetical protein